MAVSRLSSSVGKAGKGKVIPAVGKAAVRQRKVGPISTLDMGKFGTLKGVDTKQRQTHLNVLDKVSSFDQLRIDQQVRFNITKHFLKSPQMPPTPVQKVAIKALTRKNEDNPPRSWLIAAETGSGKTLAYLAPLISRIHGEALHDTDDSKSEFGVKSIVLVPTLELAEQVGNTVDKVAPENFKYMVSAGPSHHTSTIARNATKGLDLLITTPDKVRKLMSNGRAALFDACKMAVVDEADSLFNRSFSESTQAVLDQLVELQDAVFVTATIPRFFDKYLREKWPNTVRLVTPSIHRLPRHIEFRVIEAWRRPYNNSKELALQQALYAMYHDNTEPGLTKRVLVFVNRSKDVPGCVEMLNKAGFDAQAISRQQGNLGDFVQPAEPRERGGTLQVLVGTDLAARGVDFHLVRNVILYDMPPSAADLLHRAGRTGRLGTKGRVFLIVNRHESKGWVRGLETIVKRGMALA